MSDCQLDWWKLEAEPVAPGWPLRPVSRRKCINCDREIGACEAHPGCLVHTATNMHRCYGSLVCTVATAASSSTAVP